MNVEIWGSSKGSGESAKDVVKDLISLDYYPPVERKKEKKESKIISMLSTFGDGLLNLHPRKKLPPRKESAKGVRKKSGKSRSAYTRKIQQERRRNESR
jgi:hypothetical protein